MSGSKTAAWMWIAASLALIVGGWVGTARIAASRAATYPTAGQWVHSRAGWERANWQGNLHYEPTLHPLTVGSMLALIALTVTVIYSTEPASGRPDGL